MFEQEFVLYQPQLLNREEFQALLLVRFSQRECARVMLSYDFARQSHRGQYRRDGTRYFEHPKAVAAIVIALGLVDADTVIAALLHDVVEDCHVTIDQMSTQFGPRVARIVDLVSKELGPDFSEELYFAELSDANEPCAWLVKAADRLHNLSTLTDDPNRVAWCNGKKIEQVEETRAMVLPLVAKLSSALGYRSFGEWFKAQLELWCAQRQLEVQSTEHSNL